MTQVRVSSLKGSTPTRVIVVTESDPEMPYIANMGRPAGFGSYRGTTPIATLRTSFSL